MSGRFYRGELASYFEVDKLKRGKQGRVYLAKDQENENVVIKMSKRRFVPITTSSIELSKKINSQVPTSIDSIITEKEVLKTVTHPNIVKLRDTGVKDELPFIVTEYIQGPDLENVLNFYKTTLKKPRLPAQLCTKIGYDICKALEEVHSKGLYHGDVKPSNIVMQGKSSKLIDFGSSGQTDKAYEHYTGTPHFSAPEHIMGCPSAQSDIYSLGITLYTLLSGNTPFIGPALFVVQKQLTDEIPNIREHNSRVKPELSEIISKATRKRISERYESAEEMAEDLQAHLEVEEEELPLFDFEAEEREAVDKITRRFDYEVLKHQTYF
ncbi:serine/threonine protein kinase [Candidatus Woesearchaeota archaeon]|nr:MAG: serine/threonine protein kinase [Candidatus Woesearchaeota archaeon]